jgi:hypothetical protein
VSQGLMSPAGVITITTRATARQRPTTLPRHHAVAAGPAPVVSRAIYRRRRILVAVAAVASVLVMAQAGAALGGSLATPERRPASASSPARTAARSTVVRPGDSLWSVAARLAPGSDPRPVVDALAAARHGTVLQAGETIEWSG